MRSKAGWLVTLFGVLIAVLGIAMMVVLGPDGRIKTGPHPVEADGIAVVTAPKALIWAGVQVSVLAELPADKPVFVGLGDTVDVADYIKDTARLEVTGYETPWTVKTRDIKGRANLPAAPTALDWWLASGAGLGGASINTTLPDRTVSLAILSVGFSNLKGLEVTVAYGIKGGFGKGAGLVLLGVSGLWFGRLMRRGDDLWRAPREDDDLDAEENEIEEVVYIYVDEDGVEHEISAEEAEQYEIEDVQIEEFVVDREGDEVGEIPEPGRASEPEHTPEPEAQPEPSPAPEPKPYLTAGEIAGLEPTPEPKPEPEPAQRSKADAPVVYVYVDDDGVEHEITEDELDDYEFVDDDEEERP